MSTLDFDVQLGLPFPNLKCVTTEGEFMLHDYWGNGWGMLFSVPTDFSPVSTMELGTVAFLIPEFTKRKVKCIALSSDQSKDNHKKWIEDILAYSKVSTFNYPIMSTHLLKIYLGIEDLGEEDKIGRILAGRAVFIVGSDRCLKASFTYPGTTGRNFDEILRVIDSLQLCADKKVETPANWKSGEEYMVPATVSEEDAAKLFPQHSVMQVPSGKNYMRVITKL